MNRIISVIPNICEGRDQKFIDALIEQLKAVDTLFILDVSMDKTRNRTVFAFSGTKEAIFEGGHILYEEALKHIDMRRHKGEYPRIGAVDVFPFVPLKDVTIEEAIEMANEFALSVAEKYNVPVYLYGESAHMPLRKDVENIRARQYEGLEEQLKDPRWKPDLGTDEFRPDFGATIIGARYPLVSFKLLINTIDMEITRNIANAIQYNTGGLRYVTANPGMDTDVVKLSQIAVSISNYKVTPIYKVIELARLEAKRYGLNIMKVKTIGLIPQKVLIDAALYYMNVHEFNLDKLLENSIQKTLEQRQLLIP